MNNMQKLDDIVETLSKANQDIYKELAIVIVQSINSKDQSSLLQAIGTISGLNLSAEQLLISIRNELNES